MFPTQEFTFRQYISEQLFSSKPSREALQNIIFRPREVTISLLLDYARHGGVFSPACRSNNADGSFHIRFKDRQHFESSSTVFFDFDDMATPMLDFIQTLPYKPSFAYTSFSNGLDGCGYRFRLGYVFNQPIVGNKNYRELYCAVRNANHFPTKSKGLGGLDELQEEQCYFGTNTNADTYNAGYYYSAAEFEKFRYETDAYALGHRTVQNVNASVDISPEFLTDFNTLTTQEFVTKYYPLYGRNYVVSLSTSLLMDETKMFFRYPEDYVAVLHKRRGKITLKWDRGDNRKRKLFFTAQIMLHNMPSLTVENLLFNLRLERDWYYINQDNKVNNLYLINAAKSAMLKRYELNPTNHGQFKVNMKFWEEQGISAQAAANHIRHYLKVQQVRPFINPCASITENVKVLKEHGISITDKTLKGMVTKGEIQINNSEAPHTYLSVFPDDVTIHDKPIVTGMLQLIQTDGAITQKVMAEALDVDIRTIKRYIDQMKGKLIRREGNNRSGRWVVMRPNE